MDIPRLDELLQIVGDVRAEIMTARAQLARRQFLVSNVEEQQRLNTVDFAFVAPVKFVLDDVEELPMQSLNKAERLEIEFPERLVAIHRCSHRLWLCHCRHREPRTIPSYFENK